MWNLFKPKELVEYKPFLSNLNETGILTEQFKGEIEQDKVRFPAKLGEEHPFDFVMMEKLYKTFGLHTAVIDKYVDFVWGAGFYIECKDIRAKKIIEQFMQDVNFDNIGRAWTKEALNKGNGFLEIGGNKKDGVKGLKVLNANNMYVVRDNRGKIEGYNQYRGGFKGFNLDRLQKEKKVIPFKPDQIAHIPFNVVGDSAYGIGIGYSALQLIDNLLRMQKDQHWLMERKANSPLQAKLGKVDGTLKIIPKQTDIDAFGKKMEIMGKKSNWATDALVELKVVDFGNIGGKFDSVLKHDMEILLYSYQIPAVIMGMANINEGIARTQIDAFQRRIQSIQAELEKIIEEKIFKRVLQANGLDVHVEFEWGTPSVLQVEARMKLISEMMKSSTITGAMNVMLEDEMINLLKLNKDEWEKLKLEQEGKEEEERKRLEAQPQPVVPGQNAKFPQKVAPKAEQPKQPKPQAMADDMLKEIMNLIKEKKKIQIIPNFVKSKKRISLLPGTIEEKQIKQKLKIIKRKKENKNYEYEKECPHCVESWENMNDIEEWVNFNYKKYLGQIVMVLQSYEFDQIKAVNEIELEAGYLSDNQVNELRKVLDNGFKNGKGLKEMAKQVEKKVGIKDLYRMTPEGNIKLGVSGLPILSRSADKRPISIVRTEVTRMANKGAVEYYKENRIKQVRWVASYGSRTCSECETRNGMIYKIGEEEEIPLHSMCRCCYVPVTEIK